MMKTIDNLRLTAILFVFLALASAGCRTADLTSRNVPWPQELVDSEINVGWQPIRIYGEGLQPRTGKTWDCVPAWDITAIYDEADELNRHPHYYLALGNPEGRYSQSNRTKNVFWSRHIDRRFHIEYPLTSRENRRVVSYTIGDSDLEWEMIIEHRDRILNEAGLSLDSPPMDIVKALAEQWRFDLFDQRPHAEFEEDNRALNNPIEGLLHQSHCVGGATAFAALAESCGLAARKLGCGAHWIAEVKIGDEWHCVDSAGRHYNSRSFPRFWNVDYIDATLDAMGDNAEGLSNSHRGGVWNRSNPQYHFSDGSWQSPLTLRLSANNAYALYPERESWGIISFSTTRLPIIARANGFYWPFAHIPTDSVKIEAVRRSAFPSPMWDEGFFTDYLYHPFSEGQTLRQSIWLDDLKGVSLMELAIPFAASLESDFSEEAGRLMTLKIGEFSRSFAELDAWPPVARERNINGQNIPEANLTSRISLPPEIFAENAVNWIEVHNGTSSVFYAPMLPAVLKPYIFPLGSDDNAGFD